MKKTHLLMLCMALSTLCQRVYSQTGSAKNNTKMETTPTKKADTLQRILIDKLIVPANAIHEFTERMNFNRNFIKKLPGFIEDKAYERLDENGNLICVTVATWESAEAIKKAKEAVQTEYQKQGFNLPEMLKRLNITIDRGIYKNIEN